jgi:hypothetical protein
MTITKIKYNGKKVQINYEKPVAGDREPDEYSLSCSEAPRPEFVAALGDLVPFAREVCELLPDDPARWRVRGVSLSYAGEEDTMGACLCCERHLFQSNVALYFNTPIKIEEYYTGGREKGDSKQLMPEDMVTAVHTLIREAEAYINGQRAQTRIEGT